jgi:hypothetical protein
MIKIVQNCEVGDDSANVPKVEGPWMQLMKGTIDMKVKFRNQNLQAHCKCKKKVRI